MERLWSYLRRFSRMTKEMRPSHRVDVLSDAIIYYRQKAVNNIGIKGMQYSISITFICLQESYSVND